MGNNHSSPICNRLCPGSTRPLQDDPDEWFDTGKKKRRKKPTRKTGYPKMMPPLPEESPDETAFTDETTELTCESSSGNRPRSASECITLPSLSEDDASQDVKQRRRSECVNLKKVVSTKTPRVKLTFVNGQFIDLKSPGGKDMATAAKEVEAGQGPSPGELRRNEISGVDISINAGHGGVLPVNTGNRKSNKPDSLPKSMGRKTILGSKRSDSNASHSSDASGKTASSSGSILSGGNAEGNSHNAVTSIISVGQSGDGYFLTASKYDRVIKLWRVTDNSANVDGSDASPDITFVRDFVGHNTGVMTLTRIDDKGRFLSASKDGTVILWDSRYDSADDEDELESEEHRVILAKFEKMDRRAIKTIAMVEEGSYVRPDDEVDFAMLKAAARKTIMAGSAGLQQAAREKHVIGCSCQFATITGHHNVVKLWSVHHIDDQECAKAGGNCAEVKLEQEIKNDTVIQTVVSQIGQGVILTGDRMGNIKLWRGGRNMLGSNKAWACERTFHCKKKKLQTVDALMDSSITALTFLSDDVFASGTRGGGLRVWNIDEEKDLSGINGAHNEEIVDIKLGHHEQRTRSDAKVVFTTAARDGKVLTWVMTLKKNGKLLPTCCDVVNHSISSRYFTNSAPATVEALECVNIPNTYSCDERKAMLSGCSGGDINLLEVELILGVETRDALLHHREQIEEEALTLHLIAPDLLNGVDVKDRKRKMLKYKQCFLGCDAVTYLVDKGHALTRKDALDLGRILESHFNLFEVASHSGKEKTLEDDDGFYRFTDESIEKWADKRSAMNKNVTKSARM